MANHIVLPQTGPGQGQHIVIPAQINGQSQHIVLPGQATGQTVVVPGQTNVQGTSDQNMQTTETDRRKYNTTAGFITGNIQLVLGIVDAISTYIAISHGTQYSSYWGIWAGVGLYGLGGVLGIISRWNNKGVIIAYMVFSIISSIVAPCQMIYDAVASSNRGYVDCGYCTSVLNIFSNSCVHDCDTVNVQSVAHAVAAVCAAIEMIVAIIGASYGCCGTCCATSFSPTSHNQTVVIQYTQTTQPQMVTTTPNQQIPYPSAPVLFASPTPQAPPPAYEHIIQNTSASQHNGQTAPPSSPPGKQPEVNSTSSQPYQQFTTSRSPHQPYQELSPTSQSQNQQYQELSPTSSQQPYQELSPRLGSAHQPYQELSPRSGSAQQPYQELSSTSSSQAPQHYFTRIATEPQPEDQMYMEIDP